MQWKRVDDVEDLPLKREAFCVIFDANTGLGPFIAYWQPTPEKERGFYTGSVREMRRTICTHYIVLPSMRGLKNSPEVIQLPHYNPDIAEG